MRRSLLVLIVIALCFVSCSTPITCSPDELQTCLEPQQIAQLTTFSDNPQVECGLPLGFEQGPTNRDNETIRTWYEETVAQIPVLEQAWREAGIDVAQRARCAFAIRHLARIRAREAMPDQSQVQKLQERDQRKYGHPDGPTFCWLVVKNCREGKSGDAVFAAIIESAARTNPAFHKERKAPNP